MPERLPALYPISERLDRKAQLFLSALLAAYFGVISFGGAGILARSGSRLALAARSLFRALGAILGGAHADVAPRRYNERVRFFIIGQRRFLGAPSDFPSARSGVRPTLSQRRAGAASTDILDKGTWDRFPASDRKNWRG